MNPIDDPSLPFDDAASEREWQAQKEACGARGCIWTRSMTLPYRLLARAAAIARRLAAARFRRTGGVVTKLYGGACKATARLPTYGGSRYRGGMSATIAASPRQPLCATVPSGPARRPRIPLRATHRIAREPDGHARALRGTCTRGAQH